MTNAINAIQANYFAYTNELIKKEYVEEQKPEKEVIYSTAEKVPSREGYSVAESMVQQSRNVFDILRASFLAQKGINISSISSVGTVNVTTEKIKSTASEMVSLQQELTTLIAESLKLAGVSASDERLKEYQSKYIELYNKLADKKAEFDSYVNSSNLTDAKIKELCKDAYSKNENENNKILNKITELKNKGQELATKMQTTIAEAGIDSLEEAQLQAINQVYMLEHESLKQQAEISGLDLFSSDTKLEKLSTDNANLLIQFQEINEQRQIISYQLAASAGADTEDSLIQKLQKEDVELFIKQREIAEKLKIKNNDYDSTAYNLLFAPDKLALLMQQSDIEYKLMAIDEKRQSIANQLLQSNNSDSTEERNQLRAINDVYALEQTSLKTQLTMINNSSSTQTNIDNILKITEKRYQQEYEILNIENKRQIIAYQLAALEGSDSSAAKQISELKARDAELEKQQKQLEKELNT